MGEHEISASGYVNTETILYFFYKITNERGTKTVFTYAHVKWFYGQSECVYYLNYFINLFPVYTPNGQTLSNKDILLIVHFYRNIDSNPLGPTLPSNFFAGCNKMELL